MHETPDRPTTAELIALADAKGKEWGDDNVFNEMVGERYIAIADDLRELVALREASAQAALRAVWLAEPGNGLGLHSFLDPDDAEGKRVVRCSTRSARRGAMPGKRLTMQARREQLADALVRFRAATERAAYLNGCRASAPDKHDTPDVRARESDRLSASYSEQGECIRIFNAAVVAAAKEARRGK